MNRKKILLLLVLLCSTGCTFLAKQFDETLEDEEKTPATETATPSPQTEDQQVETQPDKEAKDLAAVEKPASAEDESLLPSLPFFNSSGNTLEQIQLQQAKMWARMESLDQTLREYKERIRVLEQGAIVVPSSVEPHEKQAETVSKEPVKTAMTQPRDQVFQEQLGEAIEKFQQGQIALAYIDFTKLNNTFNDLDDGRLPFWLGRCWFELKEYQKSKDSFSASIQHFPESLVIIPAKTFLARVELKLGLNASAVDILQKVIQTYPENDVKEAKQLLNEMELSL